MVLEDSDTFKKVFEVSPSRIRQYCLVFCNQTHHVSFHCLKTIFFLTTVVLSNIFRLNCDCDDEFYKCLKSVGTKTATQLGHIYFTGLGTKCFKNEHPIAGCNKHTSFPYVQKSTCKVFPFNHKFLT